MKDRAELSKGLSFGQTREVLAFPESEAKTAFLRNLACRTVEESDLGVISADSPLPSTWF